VPAKNFDLHGNVPDFAPIALLLIDVINDLEFPDGEQLLHQALPVAHRIAALKQNAKQLNIPVVYVNDNFGKWQSDFRKLVQHCLSPHVRGNPLAELLRPDENEYVVLKPKCSGFFGTTLDLLLAYLQAKALILTGLTGPLCVQFTANDAYMRDFHLFVPADCVASRTAEENATALHQMHTLLRADIRPSTALDLTQLIRTCGEERRAGCSVADTHAWSLAF
jgi:nicotinamidase-related amidase